jgi:RNA polymerase sigma-70 factor, ECF subfamily
VPGTTVEDLELVNRAQKGDVGAFSALVERYQGRVYNLAFRLVSNADDAADVAQESFIAAYESLKRFRGESSFYTWLYRLVVNKALTYRRSRDSRQEFAVGDGETGAFLAAADGGAGPVRAVEEKERAELVQAAIAGLPGDFRAVVVLRDVEGLEYEEIADVLGVAVGTVKSRLHRGRLLVRDTLAPYLGRA